jgi:O-antigen ligase
LLLAPRARRRFVLVALGLGMVLLFILANDVFWDRVHTLSTPEPAGADKSVGARVELLGANWRMALDYPLGAGHRGNELLSPAYVGREFLTEGNVRSAHNTFLAVLVDHGFPGAALFVSLQVWMIASLVRLGTARSTRPLLVQSYVAATAGAVAAYLVCGLFVNLFKAEVSIWLVAIVAALNVLPPIDARRGVPQPRGPVGIAEPQVGREARKPGVAPAP